MLRDILASVKEITEIKDVNTATRETLLRWTNRAAQEIYDSVDLPGSLWEQFFTIDPTFGQITMPWYVGDIRGVRANFSAKKITQHDMRPRYHATPWHQQPWEWRIKGRVALMRGLDSAAQLIVSIPAVEATAFSVSIIGSTTTGSIVEEILDFPVGTISVTTTNQFPANDPHSVRSITKNAITAGDVTVATSTLPLVPVAVIPNRLYISSNIVVGVNDFWLGNIIIPVVDSNVEILYKSPFIPLYSDNDVFVDPRLDEGVVWKVREHWYSKSKDEFALAQAASARAKCESVILSIVKNQESEQEKVLNVAPNRFSRAWELTDTRWAYRGLYGN